MHTLLATDFGVCIHNDHIYTKSAFSAIIFRYGKAFGKLILCCPVRNNKDMDKLTDVTQYVQKVVPITTMDTLLHRKDAVVCGELERADLVVGRVPSFAAVYVGRLAKKMKKTFMAEVMGCAWDAMWNHSLKGKLIAPYYYFANKATVKSADYALYVTQEFLQNRYPCKGKTVGVSNVNLQELGVGNLPARQEKIEGMDAKSICLMTCAAVDVRYKGQAYVIRAIRHLNKKGIQVKYYCVGQGGQSYLRQAAEKCGVAEQVEFTGPVQHERIFEMLDSCDIYIQPSLQEGLPRSVVEAMSRGCPCVGAKTGGIPELLMPECVVKRKSAKAIAACVGSMLDKGLEPYARYNFERAADFQSHILDARRNAFFEEITDDLSRGG